MYVHVVRRYLDLEETASRHRNESFLERFRVDTNDRDVGTSWDRVEVLDLACVPESAIVTFGDLLAFSAMQ